MRLYHSLSLLVQVYHCQWQCAVCSPTSSPQGHLRYDAFALRVHASVYMFQKILYRFESFALLIKSKATFRQDAPVGTAGTQARQGSQGKHREIKNKRCHRSKSCKWACRFERPCTVASRALFGAWLAVGELVLGRLQCNFWILLATCLQCAPWTRFRTAAAIHMPTNAKNALYFHGAKAPTC